MQLADALSSCPARASQEIKLDMRVDYIAFTKPWIEKLKDSTQRDPILGMVYQLTKQGWPHQRRHVSSTESTSTSGTDSSSSETSSESSSQPSSNASSPETSSSASTSWSTSSELLEMEHSFKSLLVGTRDHQGHPVMRSQMDN